MRNHLGIVGGFLIVAGLGFLAGGGIAYSKVQDGYDSYQALAEVQNVTLSYNDDGQLVDRGTTEGADAIMDLLVNDWQYPVVQSDLDPGDPLVNTSTEFMYQLATVTHHVLDGTHTVVLPEDVTTESGEVVEAGSYEFEVDGRYWTDFDRSDPIEAVAREQAWTGTVHGLTGELGVGTITHQTLQLGLGLAGLLAGLGLTFMVTGGGLIWVGRDNRKDRVPETVPESWMVDSPHDDRNDSDAGAELTV